MANLVTDVVLEGGGVKGIGLVGALNVLSERGYALRRVAGTSAGAVVGALAAAGMPPDLMTQAMREFDYTKMEDQDWWEQPLGTLGKGISLLFEKGIYEGDYIRNWLAGQLASMGVRTFADLKLSTDWAGEIPAGEVYKLVVITADVSRGRLVRLPWDYAQYGLDPNTQLVADAVRASMSIPFFFEPIRLKGNYLVDGGVLSDFPIAIFDRPGDAPPRWPTFGIKLSAKPGANQIMHDITGTLGLAAAIAGTMMNAHDQMHLDDPCVISRTMFVDTTGVQVTEFDLSPAKRELLYTNGRSAAEEFLASWDFEQYKTSCRFPKVIGL
jgi:NTE family protein